MAKKAKKKAKKKAAVRPSGLSAQEQKFALECAYAPNSTVAACRAGYTSRSATKQACKLLKRPAVRAAVEKLRDESWGRRKEYLENVQDSVLQRADMLSRVNLGDFYDAKGRLLPLKKLRPILLDALKSYDPATGVVVLKDGVKLLELICKISGLFVERRVHSGAVASNVHILLPDNGRGTPLGTVLKKE